MGLRRRRRDGYVVADVINTHYGAAVTVMWPSTAEEVYRRPWRNQRAHSYRPSTSGSHRYGISRGTKRHINNWTKLSNMASAPFLEGLNIATWSKILFAVCNNMDPSDDNITYLTSQIASYIWKSLRYVTNGGLADATILSQRYSRSRSRSRSHSSTRFCYNLI